MLPHEVLAHLLQVPVDKVGSVELALCVESFDMSTNMSQSFAHGEIKAILTFNLYWDASWSSLNTKFDTFKSLHLQSWDQSSCRRTMLDVHVTAYCTQGPETAALIVAYLIALQGHA